MVVLAELFLGFMTSDTRNMTETVMGPQRAPKAHARHVGRAATLSTGTREHRVILITQPHLWRRPHLALWGRHREGEGPSLLPGARETSSAFSPHRALEFACTGSCIATFWWELWQ